MDRNVTLEEAQADPGTYFLPYDFCRECWWYVKARAGPHDEVDAEHPDYDETDYKCDECGKRLVSADNYV
jgi:hypothetical protein